MNSSTAAAPVLHIRLFRMEDLESVTGLMRQFGYPTTLSVMKERMETAAGDNRQCTFVAEVDEQVVGMIGLRQASSYYKQQENVTEVTALIVSEPLRGTGLGRRLMASAEEWAASQDCSQLFLRSGNHVERAPAHAFYRHIGFEQDGYRFCKKLR